MKNSKGFTLIELLSVITVLAVVALITIPIVSNTIERAEKKSAGISADNYIRAIGNAISAAEMDGIVEDGVYVVMPDGNLCFGTLSGSSCDGKKILVETSGKTPASGLIYVKNGSVAFYKDILIGEYYLTLGTDGAVGSETKSSICVPTNSSTVTTGNIPNGEFSNGDEYICEVKDNTFYHFFVVSKESNGDVNLIMDRNITSDGIAVSNSNEGLVPWVSSTDYADRNTYETNNSIADEVDPTVYCSGNNNICVEEGPITALKALNIYLADWTLEERIYDMNIKAYIVEQNNQGVLVNPDPNNFSTQINKDIHAGYNTLEILNYLKDQGQIETEKLKARLMTVEEAQQNGCKVEINTTENGEIKRYNVYPESCPLYLANYLQHKRGYVTGDKVVHIDGLRGYWLLNGGVDCGYIIHDNGSLNSNYASDVAYAGIRPVITLTPSDLG